MTKFLRVSLVLVLLAGIIAAIVYRDLLDVAVLEQQVNEAGAAGFLVFMLIYAIGTVLFLPGSVLTLAGGALFGPLWGTLLNLTGATLGAMISFLAARSLAHDWVEQKVGGRMKQLKQGVEEEGWKFVAFVRLVPLFPFNLLNYALGLTRIHFGHYSIATFVFMLPGAIAYTYLGYAGREAVAGGEGMIQKIMLAIALLAIVSFLPSLVARLRRGPMINVVELKQKLDAGEQPLLLDVRSAEEFNGEQGHLPGAMLLPLNELKQRLDELQAYQEQTVMLICRTDKRSAKAAQLLAKQGFADVHVVRNGMTAWNEAGYAVERN